MLLCPFYVQVKIIIIIYSIYKNNNEQNQIFSLCLTQTHCKSAAKAVLTLNKADAVNAGCCGQINMSPSVKKFGEVLSGPPPQNPPLCLVENYEIK